MFEEKPKPIAVKDPSQPLKIGLMLFGVLLAVVFVMLFGIWSREVLVLLEIIASK